MGRLFHNDIVDTRNIIDRIEELESENTDDDGEEFDITLWSDDDRTEYRGLQEIVTEVGEDACRDGVVLIHERYFTAHIKDLYLEIGGEYYEDETDHRGHPTYRKRHVQNDELFARAPFRHINWDAMASEDASDYSELEVDGHTYLYMEP